MLFVEYKCFGKYQDPQSRVYHYRLSSLGQVIQYLCPVLFVFKFLHVVIVPSFLPVSRVPLVSVHTHRVGAGLRPLAQTDSVLSRCCGASAAASYLPLLIGR